jgi:hypothetical protein
LSFTHNEELAKRGMKLIESMKMRININLLGEQIAEDFLRRALQFWYPKFPQEGIEYVF